MEDKLKRNYDFFTNEALERTFNINNQQRLKDKLIEYLLKNSIQLYRQKNKKAITSIQKEKESRSLLTKQAIYDYLNESPGENQVGLKLDDTNRFNFMVLDLDTEDSIDFIRNNPSLLECININSFLIEKTKRGYHFWFSLREDIKKDLILLFKHIKGSNIKKAMLYCNKHKNINYEADYLYNSYCTLSLDKDRYIVDFNESILEKPIINYHHSLLPAYNDEFIEEGSRNDTLFKLMTELIRIPFKNRDIFLRLYTSMYNITRLKPSLPYNTVEKMIDKFLDYIKKNNNSNLYQPVVISKTSNIDNKVFNSDKILELNQQFKQFEIVTNKLVFDFENQNENITRHFKASILNIIEKLSTNNNIIVIGDFLYMYSSDINCWKKHELEELKYYLVSLFQYFFPEQLSSNNINDMFNLIKIKLSKTTDYITNGNDYVNFKDKIWSFKDERLINFDELESNVILTQYNDYELELNKKPKYFFKIFNDSLGGDVEEVLRLLRIILNLVITNRYESHNYFLELVGIAGSGKSTILKLLQTIIGKELMISTSFNNIERKDFGLQGLTEYTKIIVINECPPIIEEYPSVFKQLTGNDLLFVNEKFKDARYVNFQGLVILVGNDEITFTNKDSSTNNENALLRRRLCIDLKRKPLTTIPDLIYFDSNGKVKGKLVDELGSIWGWILTQHKKDSDYLLTNKSKYFPTIFNDMLNDEYKYFIKNYTGEKLTKEKQKEIISYLLVMFIEKHVTITSSNKDIITLDPRLKKENSFLNKFISFVVTKNNKFSAYISYNNKSLLKETFLEVYKLYYTNKFFIKNLNSKEAIYITNVVLK